MADADADAVVILSPEVIALNSLKAALMRMGFNQEMAQT